MDGSLSLSPPLTAASTSMAHAAPSERSAPRAARDALSRVGRFLLDLPEGAWLMLDAVLVGLGLALGYHVVGAVSTGFRVEHVVAWKAHLVLIGSFMTASLIYGLYQRETLWSRSRIVTRTLLTTGTGVTLSYALIYVALYAVLSRRMMGWALALYLPASLGLRLTICGLIQRVRRSVLVVGSPRVFASFHQAQAGHMLSEYRLMGFTHDPSTIAEPDLGVADHALGTHDQIEDIYARLRPTDVVIAADAAHNGTVMNWIVTGLHRGTRVTNEATFYEKAAGEVLVDPLTPDWFLFADLNVNNGESLALKRMIDMVGAIVGLAIALPIAAVIALLIRLDDGGPALYAQDRVGWRGQVFRLYKFRTMRINAEQGVSVWASPNDPRVTRVGKWLRRARLDELPQLVNILLGQMSFVGPRPERPDIVARLTTLLPFYAERHLVKPGLTGWAQINYGYGASVEDAKRKLQYDLYYLKNQCLELDAMILLRTLGTFLRGGM